MARGDGERRERMVGVIVGIGLAVPVLAVLPPLAFDLLFGIRPGDSAWFALSLPFRFADAVYLYWIKDILAAVWPPGGAGSSFRLFVLVAFGALASCVFWGKVGVQFARRLRPVEWPPRVRLQALVSLTVGFGLVFLCVLFVDGGPAAWENDGLDARDLVLWPEQLIGALSPRPPMLVPLSGAFLRDIPEYWVRYGFGFATSAAFWGAAVFTALGAVGKVRG